MCPSWSSFSPSLPPMNCTQIKLVHLGANNRTMISLKYTHCKSRDTLIELQVKPSQVHVSGCSPIIILNCFNLHDCAYTQWHSVYSSKHLPEHVIIWLHTEKCTHTHMHVHTHAHTHTHAHAHTCMHTHMHTYSHMHTLACMHRCVHTHTHVKPLFPHCTHYG